jgi:hypothetical protein
VERAGLFSPFLDKVSVGWADGRLCTGGTTGAAHMSINKCAINGPPAVQLPRLLDWPLGDGRVADHGSEILGHSIINYRQMVSPHSRTIYLSDGTRPNRGFFLLRLSNTQSSINGLALAPFRFELPISSTLCYFVPAIQSTPVQGNTGPRLGRIGHLVSNAALRAFDFSLHCS